MTASRREILDRMDYFYRRIGGAMEWPKSKEGDLLKMVHEVLTTEASAGQIPGDLRTQLTPAQACVAELEKQKDFLSGGVDELMKINAGLKAERDQLKAENASLVSEAARGKMLCAAVRNVVSRLSDSPNSMLGQLQEGIPYLSAFIEGRPEP